MADLMEAVTSLAKRRGIAFQSSEIYGGLRSSWDYGPLGVELRRNIRQRVVAFDGPAPRRRRRPGGRDHHVPEGLGGERPRRRVPRPARRVSELPPALPPGSPGRRRHLSELRPEALHRAPAVQPDVQDPHGSRRGRVERGLPATRDGAGDVRRLRDRPAERAQEDPVRHRADRQVVPQRDHAGQLHLPHARVRADGDGVLRRARDRRRVVRVLDQRADAVVHRPRDPQGEAAAATARARRARALREGRLGRGVRVPVRVAGGRGHREPHRLRPQGAIRRRAART